MNKLLTATVTVSTALILSSCTAPTAEAPPARMQVHDNLQPVVSLIDTAMPTPEDVAQLQEPTEHYEYSVDYDEPEYYSYTSNGNGLTRSGGVNEYNGRTETWYSSNVLHHYRTDEWTVGSDGVYRDSDGYVVVAASDLAMGSTVETSLGTGKVYDSGCANGVTDVYTQW